MGVWSNQMQTIIYRLDKTRSYCIAQGTISKYNGKEREKGCMYMCN